MNRRPLEVAFLVFAFSVLSELFCIRILRGSLAPWFHNSHRLWLLLSFVLVNLLNAATALYFCSRGVKAEIGLRPNERKQQQGGL